MAQHFLEEFNARVSGRIAGITQEALAVMRAYGWPGNIRELRNLMERLVVLKDDGRIEVDDLPAKLKGPNGIASASPGIALSDEGINLNSAVTEFEKALILQSLEKTKWVKNKAAKLLKLNRTTLVEKIKRYQLDTRGKLPDCASNNH